MIERKKITPLISHRLIKRIHRIPGISKLFNQRFYNKSGISLAAIPRSGKSIFQLVGVARSGTTLLAIGLDSHPDIYCLVEPYLSWLKRGYFEFNEAMGSPEILKDEGFCIRLPHYFLEQLCRYGGIRFLGFKETYRINSHPTFPTSEFIKRNFRKRYVDFTIAIIRDPRDVWISTVKRSDKPLVGYSIEDFVDTWRDFGEWVLQEEVFFVRYEDLVSQSVNTYKKIAVYLGGDFSPDMLKISEKRGVGDARALEGGQIFTSSVGRYRHHLQSDLQSFIESQCNSLMREFGYL